MRSWPWRASVQLRAIPAGVFDRVGGCVSVRANQCALARLAAELGSRRAGRSLGRESLVIQRNSDPSFAPVAVVKRMLRAPPTRGVGRVEADAAPGLGIAPSDRGSE